MNERSGSEKFALFIGDRACGTSGREKSGRETFVVCTSGRKAWERRGS